MTPAAPTRSPLRWPSQLLPASAEPPAIRVDASGRRTSHDRRDQAPSPAKIARSIAWRRAHRWRATPRRRATGRPGAPAAALPWSAHRDAAGAATRRAAEPRRGGRSSPRLPLGSGHGSRSAPRRACEFSHRACLHGPVGARRVRPPGSGEPLEASRPMRENPSAVALLTPA